MNKYRELNRDYLKTLDRGFLETICLDMHQDSKFLLDENMHLKKALEEAEEILKSPKETESNTLKLTVQATEIDIVKEIISSFIFMLEDSRIDKDIRKQYLETCKPLKEQFYVRVDK